MIDFAYSLQREILEIFDEEVEAAETEETAEEKDQDIETTEPYRDWKNCG